MLTKLNNPKVVKKVIRCIALGHDWKPHVDNLHRICMRCNKVKEDG